MVAQQQRERAQLVVQSFSGLVKAKNSVHFGEDLM